MWRLIFRPLYIVFTLLALFMLTIFLFPDLAKVFQPSKGQNYAHLPYQKEVIHLDQGWGDAYRQGYYFTPQGSHIIPLEMALALEGPGDTDTLIFGKNGLAITQFGFLEYPAIETSKDKYSYDLNPYGLPVGFTIDGYIEKKFQNGHKITTPMLGMNCAACHTSDMSINGKTVRIDGNQALGDFMGLITAIDTALIQTYASDDKFARFAKRLDKTTKDDKYALRQQLKSVARKREAWQRRNTPDIPPGHGRVDAFGVIFNQVTGRDLHLDSRDLGGNVRAPNAPVSYPVLWDTPHMARVQWNGSANNKKSGGVLGRNFGQVLGVFGAAEMTKENVSIGNCSTVKRRNLAKMDHWMRALNSPQWTDPALSELLPELDVALVEVGAKIYQRTCKSCHALVEDEFRDKPPAKKTACDLPITVVDADILGTDPSTVLTGVRNGAKTGLLEGLESLSRQGEKMATEEPYVNVLREAVTRSIVGSFRPVTCEGSLKFSNLIDAAAGYGKIAKSRKGKAVEIGGGYDFKPAIEVAHKGTTTEGREPASECSPEKTKYIYKPDKERQGDTYHPYAYRARPLNGIWASAPYLHNGSVPSLADMLLPAPDPIEGCPEGQQCRPSVFYVGNPEFDPERVGYFYTEKEGLSRYNTRHPGNSNAGHEGAKWGTKLDPDDRKALLEYLKSL